MAKKNLFDLVEHTAAELYVSRSMLWQNVAQALYSGKLVVLNADYCPVPAAGRKTIGMWFYEFNLAVHRSSDAAEFARILKLVSVDKKVFEIWLFAYGLEGLYDTPIKPKLKVVKVP